MGIPLIAGRTFRESDGEEAPNVILVNRSMAPRTWKNEDPMGKRITFDGEHYLEIVGVVGDVREFGPREDAPVQLYRPMEQDPYAGNVLVRTASDPESLIPAVRRAVLEANPESAVVKIQTLDEARAEAVASPRTTAQLFGLFAGLALVIAVAGIGSMLALWVRQRMREIGIRIASGRRLPIFCPPSCARAWCSWRWVGLRIGRRPGAHRRSRSCSSPSRPQTCPRMPWCRRCSSPPPCWPAGSPRAVPPASIPDRLTTE